jgi:hypothetical protein
MIERKFSAQLSFFVYWGGNISAQYIKFVYYAENFRIITLYAESLYVFLLLRRNEKLFTVNS